MMYLLLVVWILPLCSAAVFRFFFRNLQGDNDDIDSLILHYEGMPSRTTTHRPEGKSSYVEVYTDNPEQIMKIELRSGDMKIWPEVPSDHLVSSPDITKIVLCYDLDVHVKKTVKKLAKPVKKPVKLVKKPAKKPSVRGKPAVPLEKDWVKVEGEDVPEERVENEAVTGALPNNGWVIVPAEKDRNTIVQVGSL